MARPKNSVYTPGVSGHVTKLEGYRRVREVAQLAGLSTKEVMRRLGLTYGRLCPVDRNPRRRGRPLRPRLEYGAVLALLTEAGGSIRAAAHRANVPRSTFTRWLAGTAWQDDLERARRIGDYGLEERHAEILLRSGVSPEVARARGYKSLRASLRIPIWRWDGSVAWHQRRIDTPSSRRWRYANPRGAEAIVDVNPAGRDWILDPNRRLYVTESPRKADGAISHGLAAVGVQGVRLICFDETQWEAVGALGREICIVFDADGAWNPEVSNAEHRLFRFLDGPMLARVRLLRLPPLGDRAKTGLDDYLAAGYTEDELLALGPAPAPLKPPAQKHVPARPIFGPGAGRSRAGR